MRTLLAVILLLLCPLTMQGQGQDSVDVTDYDLSFDLSAGRNFAGEAVITMQLLRPCASISLQLVGTVEEVDVNGVEQAGATLDAIPTAGIAAGEPFTVRVVYSGGHNVEPYGWGGYHYDNNTHYNLGVGFEADPHVMGRSIFPCRDNFHDKATYTLRMHTLPGWTAQCSGMLQSRTVDDDGVESTVWRIDHPVSTYLVSISESQWVVLEDTVASLYGDYPLSIGFLSGGIDDVDYAFRELDTVVPMFERCFGPYRWGRIGYIATTKGSMEHVNNICLDKRFVTSMEEPAQTTIAHELGHAWFGNLVTCATEGDMWINEGGASFTAEVSVEATHGRSGSDLYYAKYLEQVLRTTHVTDNGYRSLHGMPHAYTYGSTTYEKGWMVWHSLRSYVGEENFYNAMRLLMERCAFSNIDAYQLCDSLSLYTGVDLTDFFQFHVFTPGFVDYHVEMNRGGCLGTEVGVSIRQQGVGTDSLMRSNRVPVTFFAHPGQEPAYCTRWIEFDGEEWDDVVSLPFIPEICVLDYEQLISDAATLGEAHLTGNNAWTSMPFAHMDVRSEQEANLYVEHHFGKPFGTMPGGVVRTANRYWMVRATDALPVVEGRFHFVRKGVSNSDAAHLDDSFYQKNESHDSLALLYRRPGNEYWQAVSFEKEGRNYEGSLVTHRLLPGEYTLAVVDTNALGITHSGSSREGTMLNLFPNPLKQGQPLRVECGAAGGDLSVEIVDEGGRVVWSQERVSDGQELYPNLEKGIYIVRIENKTISLQSKLIQL